MSKAEYQSKSGIRFELLKSMLIGIAALIIGFYFWRQAARNPINEFRLITRGKEVRGYVTSAEETSDIVEYNDGRSTGVAYEFYYKYFFILPDGRKIEDSAVSAGRLPTELSSLDEARHGINVEYVPNNPSINRIKKYSTGATTLWEWIWRKVALGGLLLAGCLSIGVIVVKAAIKKYKTDMQAVS